MNTLRGISDDSAIQARLESGELLNLAARVSRTEAEGPGSRFGIWVQGCPLRCPGCCNPHMLEFREATLIEVDELAQEITTTPGIEGVTLLGGEPFSQAAALTRLAEQVRLAGLSVMIFSGHRLETLQAGSKQCRSLLASCDILVDGPYVAAQQSPDRRYIGSDNQRIHFLSPRYAELAQCWEPGGNTIELRLTNQSLTINGFPHKSITRLLESLAARRRAKPDR